MVKKYRVTMNATTHSPDGKTAFNQEAKDLVPEDILDFYVNDAKSRWTTVTVDPDPIEVEE